MTTHPRSRRCVVLVTALALSFGLAVPAADASGGAGAADTDEPMGTLVTTAWLSEHLGDPDLVVLDCSVRVEMGEDGQFSRTSGRADYEAGHIPTAGFADLTGALADTDSPFDFSLPTPEEFAAAMGALGVGDDTRVVLYDTSMSVWAARVWWMLRWIGFDRAAVLDGGLNAWTAEGRELSTEAVERPARTLTPHPRPELIADRNEVLASLGDPAVCLVDVLPEASFRGEMSMYDRPGHIRGAANWPVASLFGEAGRYRPLDELATKNPCQPAARAITYCGGGIAASASAFALTRLGHPDVAVYIGSLQEWTADGSNPMEVAASPAP